MLTPHGSDLHIQLPGLLLIFDAAAFADASVTLDDGAVHLHLTTDHAALVQAQRRGKAWQRAKAQRTREREMAEAVNLKREERRR